jgi:hypothetical protein
MIHLCGVTIPTFGPLTFSPASGGAKVAPPLAGLFCVRAQHKKKTLALGGTRVLIAGWVTGYGGWGYTPPGTSSSNAVGANPFLAGEMK